MRGLRIPPLESTADRPIGYSKEQPMTEQEIDRIARLAYEDAMASYFKERNLAQSEHAEHVWDNQSDEVREQWRGTVRLVEREIGKS